MLSRFDIYLYNYLFTRIFFHEIPLCSTVSPHYYAFSLPPYLTTLHLRLQQQLVH